MKSKDLKSAVKEAVDKQQKWNQDKEITSQIMALDDTTKKNVAIILRKETLNNAPKNSAELHRCVQSLWGISIPYTATAPGFNAPFEWFADVYFERAKTSVAMASRDSGKTYLATFLHYLKNTFNPNYSSRHAAANREQASVAAGYLHNYGQDEVLATAFDGKPGKQEARWKNNGHWKIVTGSVAGVSGQHPSMASWDEIEFWNISAIEQTWAVPSERYGYQPIWAAFSTRQRSFGAMSWLVDEADSRGIQLYQWTAFETMRRCKTCVAIDNAPHGSDDEREKHCILWKACQGSRGLKSSGWKSRESVSDLCRKMGGPDSVAWKTQGLCERPSSSGLVLHNFEHAYRNAEGNYTIWEYKPELPWYAVHDPAEGKTSVIYFLQMYDDCTFIFDELVQDNCPDVTTAKQAFYEKCASLELPDPDIIVVDPHKTDAVATWKYGSTSGTGIMKSYNADVPDTRKESGGQLIRNGIEFLRREICDGSGTRRFFINPKTCPRAIRAVKEYHYPTSMNNVVESNDPDKEYSDEIDPMRYWVMYKLFKLRSRNYKIIWLH
jgi:hypothetical protein